MLLYPYEKEEKEVEGHLFSMNMKCFLFFLLYFFEGDGVGEGELVRFRVKDEINTVTHKRPKRTDLFGFELGSTDVLITWFRFGSDLFDFSLCHPYLHPKTPITTSSKSTHSSPILIHPPSPMLSLISSPLI
jgi:hypothetical protein